MSAWEDVPLPLDIPTGRRPMGHPWGWGAIATFTAEPDDRCDDCGKRYPRGRYGDDSLPMGLVFPDGRRCGPCAQTRWEDTR